MWRSYVYRPSLLPVTVPRRPASFRAMSGDAATLGVSDDPVVQLNVEHRDLWTEQNWPLGSVIAILSARVLDAKALGHLMQTRCNRT